MAEELEQKVSEAVDSAHHPSIQDHPLWVEEDRLMREVCACSKQLYDMERQMDENIKMAKGTLMNFQNQLANVRGQIQNLIQQDEEAKQKIARKMERESRRR